MNDKLSLMKKLDFIILALMHRLFGYQHVSLFALRYVYLPLFVLLGLFIFGAIVIMMLSYKVAHDLQQPIASFFEAYSQESPTVFDLFHSSVYLRIGYPMPEDEKDPWLRNDNVGIVEYCEI